MIMTAGHGAMTGVITSEVMAVPNVAKAVEETYEILITLATRCP